MTDNSSSNSSGEQKPPKIEFPCHYPIKVMGEDVDNFREEILIIVRRHSPDLLEETIEYRASRNGKYLSVKVTIVATGKEQLSDMFADLKSSGRVSMVL